MTATVDRPLRAVSDSYDEPQIAWSMRTVGRHLHPSSEDATVELAGDIVTVEEVSNHYDD